MLAELETETVLLAEGLRRGELLAPVKPWHPPAMPPIPVELIARAQALLLQQQELQAQIYDQVQHAPLVVRPRPAAPVESVPLLLDLRA